MQTLTQIWERLKEKGHESDKGSVHSYLPVYEKLLEPYRETALNVLEIGAFNGDSLRMWRQYFTKAIIYGIDESLTPVAGMADLRPLIDEIKYSTDTHLSRVEIHIFDAENSLEVKNRFDDKRFDVIIEDAGHDINQQLNLYRIWSKYLADGGIYIIEDVQDIDRDKKLFEDIGGIVCDSRYIKNRYDDVIIIF